MDIIICEPVILRLDKGIANVTFRRLEIRVESKDYMLTNYESKSFDLNTDTFEILNGEKKFSFINGKEIVVSIQELCEYGNNAQILVGKLEPKLIEEYQKTWVDPQLIGVTMYEIESMHLKHTEQARMNLIDLALETGDKELFERMCRMEVPQCK